MDGPLRQRCGVFFLMLAAGGFLQVLSEGGGGGGGGRGGVFSPGPGASSVFLRSKRANSFFIEEMLQGNLERECYEERCTYEEAREYYENTPRTDAFWATYFDGDQCAPSPCLHGGACTDRVGGYTCNCSWPFYGVDCELSGDGARRAKPPTEELMVVPEFTECPTEGPTACEQFCTMMYDSFTCSCSPGYSLHEDLRSCSPQVKQPCGRVSQSKPEGQYICPHRHCPWQVSLMDSGGEELCGGVVLGRRSVLSSAQCLFLGKAPPLKPSDLYVQSANQVTAVRAFYTHSRYRPGRHDDDLVLLQLAGPLALGPALFPLCLPTRDFSENVLMRPGRAGLTGQSPERLTYTTLGQCRGTPNVSHPITNKMFCMRRTSLVNYDNMGPGRPGGGRSHGGPPPSAQRFPDDVRTHGTDADNATAARNNNATAADHEATATASGRRTPAPALSFPPGTPMATEEQGTVFLTGLLLSPPGGPEGQRVPVFTKLSRYLAWIHQRLELVEEEGGGGGGGGGGEQHNNQFPTER